MSSASTSITRPDGNAGYGAAAGKRSPNLPPTPRSNLHHQHNLPTHSRSQQQQKSVFDMPNPDQAFDLIEIIGKGSFGVVHRA